MPGKVPTTDDAGARGTDYHGCAVPAEIHAIGFGWDPQPEVSRLLFLMRETAGWPPHSVLELGCGTGRLLPTFQQSVPEVWGLDLSAPAIEYARRRCAATLHVGDMTQFDLGRAFDLLFTSANTIRHVCAADSLRKFWRSAADHLRTGGVFIADVELGLDDQAVRVGKPATWAVSRGATTVHVTWEIVAPPDPQTRCCLARWTFEARGDDVSGTWSETFPLRTYDAGEFVAIATADGRLQLRGVYELRDPYLFPRPVEKAVGRMLVVLQSV